MVIRLGQLVVHPLLGAEEIETLGVAELGKAAKVSLAEGDLTEEPKCKCGGQRLALVAYISM